MSLFHPLHSFLHQLWPIFSNLPVSTPTNFQQNPSTQAVCGHPPPIHFQPFLSPHTLLYPRLHLGLSTTQTQTLLISVSTFQHLNQFSFQFPSAVTHTRWVVLTLLCTWPIRSPQSSFSWIVYLKPWKPITVVTGSVQCIGPLQSQEERKQILTFGLKHFICWSSTLAREKWLVPGAMETSHCGNRYFTQEFWWVPEETLWVGGQTKIHVTDDFTTTAAFPIQTKREMLWGTWIQLFKGSNLKYMKADRVVRMSRQ